jgi:ATP-dependent Clp protease ATP-binding subunit ClpX
MFELPALEGVEEVVVNRETIEQSTAPLRIYAERSERKEGTNPSR